MTDEPSSKDMLDHVGRYFALHSAQRMSLFNFFIVVSGTLGAAVAASLRLPKLFNLLGIAVGVLLAAISFVFWKLDQRSAFLVKHAEDAIKELEKEFPVAAARVFLRERELTDSAIKAARTPWIRMWTYGRAFRVVFWSMGATGVLGAILAWAQYRGWWML
jgi:hypothetical protein